MIKSKSDLKRYIARDMRLYYEQSKRERFMNWLTCDPIYYIAKYLYFLRKEEFYYNVKSGKLGTLCYLFYFRKKNKLGNKLGFKIPKNCVGPGVTIYHHGEIIINETARIGSDCHLHGGNCIGNNGIEDKSPCIGDGLDLGIGAKIVGNVILGNSIRVGANSVVTKSYKGDGITLIGAPARER